MERLICLTISDHKDADILKILDSMSGEYRLRTVFTDWVEMCAIAISNACELRIGIRNQREQRFSELQKRYDVNRMAEAFSLLVNEMEDKPRDILGDLYMKTDQGNKATGQFFTPYHLSEVCAGLMQCKPDEDGIFRMHEPACGSGGMMIAMAQKMKADGIDYQRYANAVCFDIDRNCVHMAYVQLSLIGLSAKVAVADTLSGEPVDRERIFITPMWWERGWIHV